MIESHKMYVQTRFIYGMDMMRSDFPLGSIFLNIGFLRKQVVIILGGKT